MFKNREDAGKQLAERLGAFAGSDAVVLSVPRGGVVVGAVVAQALHLPLETIAICKIGHPRNPEFAVGAVDENGLLLIERSEASEIDEKWLHEEIGRAKLEAKRRALQYRFGEPVRSLTGKTAIVVDDGIATGLSMRLAVGSLHAHRPGHIVVAVPVASGDVIEKLKEEGADEVIAVEPPEKFKGSIGAHYARFDQLDDEEVVRRLHAAQLPHT